MVSISGIGVWGDSIGKGIIYDEARGRYMIYGDNCFSRLARELEIPVDNYAAMGLTAPQGAAKMESAAMREGGIAVIEFGGNDCDMPWAEISKAPDEDHQPKTPIAEFREALARLVQRARKGGMQPVLAVPPPLGAERYFKFLSKGLNAEAILSFLGDVQRIYRWQERYAGAVRDVALKTSAAILDFRDAFLAERSVDSFLCVDGIHPNPRGHALIWEVVTGFLQNGAAEGRWSLAADPV